MKTVAVFDVGKINDPLYAALVAALNPDMPVLVNQEHSGTATGAALLASHEARSGPILIDLHPPLHVAITGLAGHRTRWRERAVGREGG
jgi:hypothetical protein